MVSHITSFSKTLKRNWIVFSLCLLCIFSIYYISKIIFNIGELTECNYSLTKIEKINSLVVDICIGILTSTLFYILLVYLPDYSKKRAVRNIICSDLEYIANNMQMIFSYIMSVNKDLFTPETYNDNYSDIPLSVFAKINKIENTKKHHPYSVTIEAYLVNKYTNSTNKIYAVDQPISYAEHRKLILQLVSSIQRLPLIIFEEPELIQILNDIKISIFLSSIKTAEIFEETYKTKLYIQGVSSYYTMYVALLKFVTPNTLFKLPSKTGTLLPIIKL